MVDLDEPTDRERAIFYLKTLIELIENDQIRADEIESMTAAEVLNLAEREADTARENAGNLASGN